MKAKHFLVSCLLLCGLCASVLAQVRPGNILADGSDDRYWIATIGPAGSQSETPFQTSFYIRVSGATRWRSIATIPGRARNLGHRGAQLAALFEGGEWVMIAEDGSVTDGPPLPMDSPLIAIAGMGDTLWGIGGSSSKASDATATSGPSTRTSTTHPTSAPATAVAAVSKIYELVQGQWIARGTLPADYLASGGVPHLSVIGNTPWVSMLIGDRTVRILRFRNVEAAPPRTIDFPSPLTAYQIISGTQKPILWALREGNHDELRVLNADAPGGERLLPDVPLPRSDSTAAYALGRVRVVWSNGKDLSERLFDPTELQPVGDASRILLQAEPAETEMGRWIEWIIWAALVMAIMSAMRLRTTVRAMVFDLEKIHLASPLVRLVAGLIDLIPLMTGAAVLLIPNLSVRTNELVALLSLLVYLLHTTLSEVAFGRSLGKKVMGLKVVALDGERPTPIALLIRNLLRIIDIGLLLVPLTVIFFSPLRQRTGDVAAGTLVVTEKKPE